jgi:spore coat protein CotH
MAFGSVASRWLESVLAIAVLASSSIVASAQTQDDFFDDRSLQEVHIAVSERDWSSLKSHFDENTYYTADLTWRGLTIHNVGIRSRGGGTRNGIKPGLKVDLNHYVSNQEFLGLKAFELKNMAADPSLLRERVAMKLYAQVGIPVPREAHARLYINNQYSGLFVIVESIDRTFLSRTFGSSEAQLDTGGHLFEYKWVFPYDFGYLGTDLRAYAPLFEPQTRETDAVSSLYAPIEAMIRTINESNDEDFATAVGTYLDTTLFLKYLAVELFTVEWDGFAGNWEANNFYLYRFRQGDRSQLIPKDRDHAFNWDGVNADDFLSAPITLRLDTNVLTRRVMAAPQLRQIFLDALGAIASAAAAPAPDDPRGWLEREIERESRQVASAVAEDPVFPFSLDAFQAEVDFLLRFGRARPGLVAGQIVEMEALAGGE